MTRLFEGFNPCVPVADLRVWPGNPRKTVDQAKVDALADSIRAIGLQQPIVVRPADGGGGEIIAGQRRYLACVKAGHGLIPCVVRELSDEEALEVAIAENAARTDVSPIEEAEAIDSYLSAGRTAQQAASKFGQSVAWVESRRRLLSLSPAWRSRVAADSCPIKHAELLSRLKPETQDVISKRFEGRELPPFIEFERVVLATLHRLSEAPFDVQDETYPRGSCHGCPSRSDRQGSLFGGNDPEDAACLDPACWAGRVAHRWELAQKSAKKRKLRVLSTEDAGLYVSGTTASSSAWVEMERAEGEGLTAQAISRTEDGHVVELVSREDYARAIEARRERLKAELEAKAAERGAQVKQKGEAQSSEPKSDPRKASLDKMRAALDLIASRVPHSLDVLREIAAECESWADDDTRAVIRELIGPPAGAPWSEMQASDCIRGICLYAVGEMTNNIAEMIAAVAKRDAERARAEDTRAHELVAADVDPDIARMIARFEGEITAARGWQDLAAAWKAIESEDHRASLPALAKLWTAKATELGVSSRALAKMRKAGEAPAKEAA